MATGFFCEMENGDVGPFVSRALAECYAKYDSGEDFFQVFTSEVPAEMLFVAYETSPAGVFFYNQAEQERRLEAQWRHWRLEEEWSGQAS